MFTIYETGFDELFILETKHFQDERGVFHKFFSKDEFDSLGLDSDFQEDYYSINHKNVIRGMHFQIPPADHIKLVYVTSGSIVDVVLDIRKNSATYGKYFSVKLSGDEAKCLYIPKGFAHGFVSLEDDTCVHYLQTSCYDKEYDRGIRYDSFGFDWGVDNPVVSGRDAMHPLFNDFDTPFTGKKVVLTGATGLIGKEAIEPLKKAGFEVYCLTSKKCNLFDYDAVSSFFRKIKPQYLLHFAWITGGDYLSNTINSEYVAASMNMLRVFTKYGGKRAVFAGTCFEYDFKDALLKESDELNPRTLYAQCKVKLNALASEYCASNGISFGWGRIFYVYGHNENKDRLSSTIIDKLRHNETVTVKFGQLCRDYMYSKDVAAAFVKFLDSDVTGAVNICTGRGVTLGDYAKKIAGIMNKTVLLDIKSEKTDQPAIIIGNNDILKNKVLYNSFEELSEGLTQII